MPNDKNRNRNLQQFLPLGEKSCAFWHSKNKLSAIFFYTYRQNFDPAPHEQGKLTHSFPTAKQLFPGFFFTFSMLFLDFQDIDMIAMPNSHLFPHKETSKQQFEEWNIN